MRRLLRDHGARVVFGCFLFRETIVRRLRGTTWFDRAHILQDQCHAERRRLCARLQRVALSGGAASAGGASERLTAEAASSKQLRSVHTGHAHHARPWPG